MYLNTLYRLNIRVFYRTRCITVGCIHTNTVQKRDFSQATFYANKSTINQNSILSAIITRHISTSLFTQGVNVRPQKITSRLAAEQLIRDMSEEERDRVYNVLQGLEQELFLEKGTRESVPNYNQLYMLAFANSIPFVGFGFLDNAIMIVAGEYIDYTLGAALGISTMAAAAIGNMISDIAGIGLAGYVESWASRLGLEEPNLTPLQLTMKESRIACHFGRAIGIVIGCIIGMFPLLFIAQREDESGDQHHDTTKQVTKTT